MKVEFARSVWRPWLAGLVAVPLLLVAVDLAITHQVFREPAADAEGRRTNQGLSEERADWIWGLGLAAAGLGLVYWSLRELSGPRNAVSADEEGIYLGIGPGRGEPVFVPWDQVLSVRSSFEHDDTGPTPKLEVAVDTPGWLPLRARGAAWKGNRIVMDATGWQVPVHRAAGLLQTMLERYREPEPT